MINLLIAAGATFFGMFILIPVLLGIVRLFGLYTIVEERQCKVYMLFGKVVAVPVGEGGMQAWMPPQRQTRPPRLPHPRHRKTPRLRWRPHLLRPKRAGAPGR